jgi:hypothetical protein
MECGFMDKCRDTAFASYACPLERSDCMEDGVCFCESDSFGTMTVLAMLLMLVITLGVCCFFLCMERRNLEEAGAAIFQGRAAKYGTVDNSSLPVRGCLFLFLRRPQLTHTRSHAHSLTHTLTHTTDPSSRRFAITPSVHRNHWDEAKRYATTGIRWEDTSGENFSSIAASLAYFRQPPV